MMDFVRDAIRTNAVDAYSFPRHHCAVSPDGRLLRHTSLNAAADKQWRLYRADRVRYRITGHTPGFYLDELILADAPPEAAMIHLDWAVHSFERRKSKIERYDMHTPNDGTKFRSVYLYEEDPCHASRFRRLYLREFDRIAGTLAERFPDLTIVPLLGDNMNFPDKWHVARIAELEATLAARSHILVQTQARLSAFENSTSWRLTHPLRLFLAPRPGLRRMTRGVLKLAWWTATLQLPRRLRKVRQGRR